MKVFRQKSDNRIDSKAKKTKANSGETLIEVLVSLLIISISIALLITTLSCSGGLIKESKEKFAGYYDQNNNLVTQTNSGAGGSVTLKFTDASDGASEAARIAANADVLSLNRAAIVDVSYYINEKANKEAVASYRGVFASNYGGSGGTGGQ